MSVILGLDGKAYYGNALLATGDESGADAVTWTELTNVTDVTQSAQKAEADISTRATQGWRATRGTLKEGTVEFEMNWDPDDAGFTAIQTAFMGDDELSMMFLDGSKDTAGSQGLCANFDIINFSRSEPLEEAMKASVTVKISSKPFWRTITT